MHILYMTFCSTVPGSITGVMLMCEVMDQINQCTVQWDVSFTYLCMYVRTVCIIRVSFRGHGEHLPPLGSALPPLGSALPPP